MSRRSLTRAIFLFAAIALAFAATPAAYAAAAPIKIGYLAILTGDGSVFGQEESKGAQMVIDEVNAQGGLFGRKLELVVYDIKGRAEDTINAARRMIDSDKVVAIGGPGYSGLAIAVAPLMDRGKVPLMASAATNPAVTVNGKTGKALPYMFRIGFTDPYQGRVAADYLVNKLGVKDAAIIYDVGSDYSQGLREFFLARMKELNAKVLSDQGFRGGDVDFRAQLTVAKSSGAKGLFMPTIYKEMGLMMRQAHELGWKPAFIGGDGWSVNVIEVAGPASEGAYFISSMSIESEGMKAVLAKYKKKYGKDSTEPTNVGLGYDILQSFVASIKKAGKAEGPAIRDALESMKNLKLAHFTLNMDPATHNPLNKPAAIIKVENGKIVFVELWAPQGK